MNAIFEYFKTLPSTFRGIVAIVIALGIMAALAGGFTLTLGSGGEAKIAASGFKMVASADDDDSAVGDDDSVVSQETSVEGE